ncbi:MAG: AraC family transcriptional regulator [Oscillospiraceae bacterium]
MAVKNICDLPATKVEQDDLSKFFDALNLTVESFGRWRQTDVKSIINYTISDYELVFCISGEVDFVKNGEALPVKAGQALFLEPFNIYSARCMGDIPVEYFYIHFRLQPYYLHSEFSELFTNGNMVFPLSHPDVVLRIFEELWKERLERPDGYAYYLKMLLVDVLIKMAHCRRAQEGHYTRPQYNRQELDIVCGAIKLVSENMSHPVRVSEISKEIGVSESKLYKCFNEIFKVSPSRYFTQMKIRRAEQLLISTDKTIEQISEELGFSSAFHLSKSYKELLGIAPSHTRKKYKNILSR